MSESSSFVVKLIKEKYKSVRQFSFATGIPYTTIESGLKAGIGSMAVETVRKMCNALDIQIESLIAQDVKDELIKQSPLSAEEWCLILEYRSLSDNSKQEIRGYLEYRLSTDANAKKRKNSNPKISHREATLKAVD